MIKQVKKKLEDQLKAAAAVNKYASVIAKPCMEALISFCEQDEEFLQAVHDGDFVECMKKITGNIGKSISDIEVYRRAAEHYFKGAKVRFEMQIQVNPYEDKAAPEKSAERTDDIIPEAPKSTSGFVRLSLDDLIGG